MIQYHGAKISGGNQEQMAFEGKHAMISFAGGDTYTAQTVEAADSFCCDNGAYTLWNQQKDEKHKKEFPVGDYLKWLLDLYWRPSFDFFIIPDVIDGDHHDNARLRALWFQTAPAEVRRKGWPVYHMHEPISVLSDLMHAFPHGLCLGSSGKYRVLYTKDWWIRMAEMMEVLTDERGKPKVPMHGLRMMDARCFSHVPLRSCDSISCGMNAGAQDGRWDNGMIREMSVEQKAIFSMYRVAKHAKASTWNKVSNGIQSNGDLFD